MSEPIELEIPPAEFKRLVTPGTQEDDAQKAATEKVDPNVSLTHEQNEEDQLDNEAIGELFATVASIGSEYLVARRGEHWRMSPQEMHQLKNAFGRYMETAFPDVGLTPGWAFIGVLGFVVLPKAMTDYSIQQEVKAMEEQKKKESELKNTDTSEGLNNVDQ